MSSQTKLIKDILSTYESILENRNVLEAADVYDNVDFKDNEVGNSTPSRDTINTALLQDVQAAAKSAGLKVDITTAVSGHGTKTKSGNTSRHPSGNAVDIAKINGKSVSLSNRADADKLVAALVSMGYTKNSEGPSNPKSVLTFGVEGHDNHVHISNTTSSTSQQPTNTDTSGTTSDTTSGEETTTTSTSSSKSGEFARQIGKSLLNAIGINESKFYSSFGKNHTLRGGEIILPKESNSTVKSPVDGVISHTSHRGNCNNPLTIKVRLDDETLLLSYCGLESTGLRIGDRVNKGDVLGRSDSDVRVTLTTLSGRRQYIDTNKEIGGDEYPPEDKYSDDSTNEYSRLLRKGYHDLKKNLFKREPKNKVQENIDRIKGLLK
jgi:hypothetical protein